VPERDLVGSVVVTRYRVIKQVASGATADIYEAEHVNSKNHVALKVLSNNDASSEVAARFLREGKTLGMFRHPNIVELLEVGRLETGRLFLATELVRGQSLRDLIQEKSLVPRRVLTIAREILDALGHAHGMGIVHRGMRPENVMITEEGSVKVLDFGVAKLATDTAAVLGENKLTRTGIAVLGDPRYSAPEVARGGDVDARADLYAVGAMLKEILAASIPTSTPQMQLLISDSTQPNADKRFRNAAEMRDAVDAAIASLDETAASSGVVASSAPASSSAGWSLDSQPTAAAPAPAAPPTRSSASILPGVTERPSKQKITIPPSLAQPPEIWTGEPNLTASESSRPPISLAEPKPRRDYVALAKKHKYFVGGVLGGIVLLIVIIAIASGGSSGKKTAKGEDGRSLAKRGHEELEAGRRADAMSLYDRAISADSSLAGDADIRHDAQAVVESKDAVAAVIALELLASRVSPPAKDIITAAAATGKNGDVRRRALAIAERDGFADEIDKVASLSLDLAQATTCEDRRSVIGKLRATADKRAVAPLKKAKVYKCVERDATVAIAELEAKP
jgi:serine/threonine protein kinase